MPIREAVQLHRAGRASEAEAECRRHLRQFPNDHAALHLLGTIVHEAGRNDEAVRLMEQSVRLAPAVPQYRVNLAAVLGRTGRPADAVPHLLEALKRTGDIPELHNNLGAALEALDRLVEAEASYRTALRGRPDYAEACHNLGNVLRKMGRYADAAGQYREALRLRPDYAKAYDGLSACAVERGDAVEAVACCRQLVALDANSPWARSALLYTLHYDSDVGPEALWREHREWGRRFCDPLRGRDRPHANDFDPGGGPGARRLRVGYVSPDLREHTVPRFIAAAMRHHDRSRFELFCYSDAPADKADAVTASLKPLVENWRDTAGVSDERLDEVIRQDLVDILVDLRGHAAQNRLTLFARKPAPVQVNMVGYFDTTGLGAMDWRVTDARQDPPGESERFHTEGLMRLPGGCWCYTADEELGGASPPVRDPPALANGFVTFGSLNKLVKVTARCAELWARVLETVPGSRLLMSAGGDAGEAVTRHLEAAGLPPQRLTLVGKTRTRDEYLARFHEVDVCLDTFPFNGITTTCDGLWMGVPAVSLAGPTTVSRAGRSILHSAGLGHLAVDSPDAFVAAAAALARDVGRLRDLRREMRSRLAAAPLMDHRGFAAALDDAFLAMWRRRCGERRGG